MNLRRIPRAAVGGYMKVLRAPVDTALKLAGRRGENAKLVVDQADAAARGAAGAVLGDMNPNDVKRVDVLKDAGSLAAYGSRGANGVLLITTKRR